MFLRSQTDSAVIDWARMEALFKETKRLVHDKRLINTLYPNVEMFGEDQSTILTGTGLIDLH